MPPVVLAVSLKDDASAGLRGLHAEIGKLGGSAASAAPGLNTLGTATQALRTRTLDGTGSIQGWKKAQEEAAKAAAASIPKIDGLGAATEKAHKSFFSSTKSALAFGTAVTGMQLGLSAVGNAVQAVVSHVVQFESSMANVNTLGNNSVAVQAKLREELLKLPAAFGDSVTLAKGLYDVLSAGIPAAEAVAFLGVSAKLAQAGLADVGTTTEALTKSMAAFKIPTELAGQVADIFFKTVDLGQGNLQAFAHAMPQVTQIAGSMGLSFGETAAFLATLTQTFGNADKAATGFRSMLTQAIQNSDKFAAAGVNIVKVIGEEGLVGFMRVLQEVTGGNSEKLKDLIGDTEGYAAAVAGSGPQFKLFLENLEKTKKGLGVVEEGLKTQAATAEKSWKAFTAEAGKAADQIAPPFLATFSQILRGARLFAEDTNTILRSIKSPQATPGEAQAYKQTQDAIKAQAEEVKNAAGPWGRLLFLLGGVHDQQLGIAVTVPIVTKGIQAAANAAMDEAGAMNVLDASLFKSKSQMDAAGQASQALSNDLAGLALTAQKFKPGSLEIIDPESAAKSAAAAIAAFGRIEASGKVSFAAILSQARTMLDGIRDQMGASSPVTLAFAAMVDGMETRARTGTKNIDALFKEMNFFPKERLQQDAETLSKNLVAMVRTVQTGSTQALEVVRDASGNIIKVIQAGSVSGLEVVRDAAGNIVSATNAAFAEGGEKLKATTTATNAQLVQLWHGMIDAINKGELPQLTSGMQDTMNLLAPIVKKATGEVAVLTRDAYGKIRIETEKTVETTKKLATAFDLTGISAEAAAANYRKLAPALDAVALAHAEATREAAGFGTMLQRNIDLADLTLEATTKLNEGLARASYQMDFADDAAGLRAQLARARKERGQVANQPDPIGTQGFREFTLNALDKEITILLGKLDDLKAKETDTLTTATTQTDRLTASTAQLTTQTMAAGDAAAQLGAALSANVSIGSGLFYADSGRMSGYDPLRPDNLRPYQPGDSSNLTPYRPGRGARRPRSPRPPGWNIPGRRIQRFAQGGLVTGSGGVDSVPALLTPGERVVAPGQDRALNISFGPVTIQVGGAAGQDPVEMGRIAAQSFVRQMAPALNESLKRGNGERFV